MNSAVGEAGLVSTCSRHGLITHDGICWCLIRLVKFILANVTTEPLSRVAAGGSQDDRTGSLCNLQFPLCSHVKVKR